MKDFEFAIRNLRSLVIKPNFSELLRRYRMLIQMVSKKYLRENNAKSVTFVPIF